MASSVRAIGPRYKVIRQRFVADRVNRGVSDGYTPGDAAALAAWLNERAAGYPSLARLKDGAAWPLGDPSPIGLDCNGERVGFDKFAPCCRKPPKRAPRHA